MRESEAKSLIFLCPKGHLSRMGQLEELEDTCRTCGEKFIWKDTWTLKQIASLEVEEAATGEACPHCGVFRFTQPPRYRIPT